MEWNGFKSDYSDYVDYNDSDSAALGNIQVEKGIDAWTCCGGDLFVSSPDNGLIKSLYGTMECLGTGNSLYILGLKPNLSDPSIGGL